MFSQNIDNQDEEYENIGVTNQTEMSGKAEVDNDELTINSGTEKESDEMHEGLDQEEVNDEEEPIDAPVDIHAANRGSDYHQYWIEAAKIMGYPGYAEDCRGTCNGYALSMMLLFLYGQKDLMHTIMLELKDSIEKSKNKEWDLHKSLKLFKEDCDRRARNDMDTSHNESLNYSMDTSMPEMNNSTQTLEDFFPQIYMRAMIESIALIQRARDYPTLFARDNSNKFVTHDIDAMQFLNQSKSLSKTINVSEHNNSEKIKLIEPINEVKENTEIHMAYSYAGIYTKEEHAKYFQFLNQLALKQIKDFAIALGSFNHCMVLLYDAQEQEWMLVDANKDVFYVYSANEANSQEISNELFKGFFEKENNGYMAFTSEIYGLNLLPDDVFISELKESAEHKNIHENMELLKDRVNGDNVSLLALAVQIGRDDIVKKLCQSKTMHLNTFSSDDYNPCKIAAEFNRVESLKLLLEHGADYTLGSAQAIESINTPLHCATKYNHAAILELLFNYSFNLKGLDHYSNNLLHLACKMNNTEAFLVLAKHIDVNSDQDNQFNMKDLNLKNVHGFTPIMYAASNGNFTILKTLFEKGADISSDKDNQNLLHNASSSGDIDCLNFLIEKFDINSVSNDGTTPLMYATEGGHRKAIEFLLKNGANKKTDNNQENILNCATLSKNIDIVKLFLDESLINQKNDAGQTPIMMAAKVGSQEIYNFLIENGADVLAIDNGNNTAITYAVEGESKTILSDLLKKIKHADMKTLDSSALSLAILRNKKTVVKLLIENGFSIHLRDGILENLPIVNAVSYGHASIFNYLLEYQTKTKCVDSLFPTNFEEKNEWGDTVMDIFLNKYIETNTIDFVKKILEYLDQHEIKDLNKTFIDPFVSLKALAKLADNERYSTMRLLFPYINFAFQNDDGDTALDICMKKCMEKNRIQLVTQVLQYFASDEKIDFNKTLSEANKKTLFKWGIKLDEDVRQPLLLIPSIKDSYQIYLNTRIKLDLVMSQSTFQGGFRSRLSLGFFEQEEPQTLPRNGNTSDSINKKRRKSY